MGRYAIKQLYLWYLCHVFVGPVIFNAFTVLDVFEVHSEIEEFDRLLYKISFHINFTLVLGLLSYFV